MARTIGLGDAVLRIRADMSQFTKDIRNIKNLALAHFSMYGISVATRAMDALGTTALRVLGDISSAVANANAQFERMSVTFGAMLKDKRLGELFASRIEEFAARTPFSSESLMRGAQLLKNYGVQLRKILPAMEAIGNAAAASPGEMQERVGRIALAIGQIKSQGKLMGQELRQLAEAGVGAQEILQKAFKATIPEIQNAIKSGAISIDDVIDELLAGMNRQFEGVMEEQAKTWDGMWERIGDKGQIALRKISGPLFELAKSGVAAFADMFESKGFQNFVSSSREAMQSVVDGLKQAAEFAKPLGEQLVNSFQMLKPLVFEIVANLSKLPMIADAFTSIRDVLITSLSGATLEIRKILDMISLLTTNFQLTWELFGIMAEIAFNSIAARIDHFFSYWETVIGSAANMLVNVFSAAFNELGTMLMGLVSMMQSAFKMIGVSLATQMENTRAMARFVHDSAILGPERAAEILGEKLKASQKKNKAASDEVIAKYVAWAKRTGQAHGNIATAAMAGFTPAPKFKEPGRNQELRNRAVDIVKEMLSGRNVLRNERNQAKLKEIVGGTIAGGLQGFGGAIKGGAGGLIGMMGGLARAAAVKGKDEGKRAKAEFVGIAEMSKKIQLGIANSEEAKDRKAMVKGIGMVEKAVKGVKEGVGDVVDAIKGWIPRAS